MKIKEESKAVENLLMAAPAVPPEITDQVPFELEDPEPVFTVDYVKEMKSALKKARNSIKTMLKSSIPSNYLDDEYIKDKIEQDAESLGRLYYQQRIIEIVEQANVDAIGSGNISARLIEVFNQTAKSLSDIADQINKMQVSLRKAYIDIVLDLKYKAQEEEASKMSLECGTSSKAMIEEKKYDYSNVFVGTKDMIKSLADAKKQEHKQNYQEAEEINS